MSLNKYKGTFYFDGSWQFFKFTANMLANASLECTDDIADFMFDEDDTTQSMMYRIYGNNGKEYDVVFSSNPRYVSVYNIEKCDENGEETPDSGRLVEKDIPWLLLEVFNKDENNCDKTVYSLLDYI